MLRVLDSDSTPRLCDRLSRREWLRIGSVGLGGLSLAGMNAARASVPAGKAKSVIIMGLLGGPAQHESWDPKPNAPAEVRGTFGTIPTRTPGYRVCELMPLTAKHTDKIAVLRAVSTGDNAHSSSGYQMLTGVPHSPLNSENQTVRTVNNWPVMGSVVRYLQPAVGQLPSAVTLPEHLWNDGNFTWPGQDGGLLGHKFDPWLVPCDPNDPKFRIEAVDLPGDIPPLRYTERQSLLSQVNRHLDGVNRTGAFEHYDVNSRKAYELLSSGAARKAFDINQEPAAIRDRYGRTRFGQSCLLARRLVEAGVSLVQVNWTRLTGKPNPGWDTHSKHADAMKDYLMPMMDQTYSALLDDLDQRGLLDSTLVVWFGEFGRTPRFNGNGGRDHWGHVFSLALAGGGVRGGVVHGTSDKNGAYPSEGKVEPRDLIATVFHCLGYPPDTEMRDTLGRPLSISRGEPIRAVL